MSRSPRFITALLAASIVAGGACSQVGAVDRDHGAQRIISAQVMLVDAKRHLTPFDTWNQTIGNLDPNLLAALQDAARAAKDDGVTIGINWGWRSPETQQRMLNSAIKKYGSLAEARRWVQTPEGSKHVAGRAVDIAGTDAARWLHDNGRRFGLCQIYANESWHYELAVDQFGNCPALIPDASFE